MCNLAIPLIPEVTTKEEKATIVGLEAAVSSRKDQFSEDKAFTGRTELRRSHLRRLPPQIVERFLAGEPLGGFSQEGLESHMIPCYLGDSSQGWETVWPGITEEDSVIVNQYVSVDL